MSPHVDLPPPSHVLHRNLLEKPYHVVSGSGMSLQLSTGQKVLDACGGAAVASLGASNAEVTAAVTKQMSSLSYIYSGAGYTTEPAEELATLILGEEPGSLCKAIFVNSGSEAMEAALKAARQYHVEKGDLKRTQFVSRKQSYHGNTLGALSVSGHEARRALYTNMLASNVTFVDPCHPYRGQHKGESDEDYVQRLRTQLEDEFVRVGADTVAAFIAETMSGSTLGCATAVPGYFVAVREVCDKYGVLLILDEVMCGMGKTGTIHAWQQEGIAGPDIQTIAKALGGGFAPIAGVLLSRKVVDVMYAGTGTLQHGHTYQAHPASCAAAATVQKIVKRENLMANVKTQGELFGSLLKSEILPLPLVGDVRGRGVFWSIEFVKNKETKETFSLEDKIQARVVKRGMELGVAVLAGNGKSDAPATDLVTLSLPYNVTAEEVKTVVALLKTAIEDVGKDISA